MRKSIGLRGKVIVAFILLIIIPIAVIGSLSYYETRDVLADQLKQSNLKSIESVDNYYLLQLTDRIEAFLDMHAENPDIGQMLTSKKYSSSLMTEWGNSIKGMPDVASIYLGTTDGRMFLVPSDTLPEGYDPRTREWYKEAWEESGDIIWTKPYLDAGTTGMVLSVSRQVNGTDNTAIGVLSLDVKLDKLVQLLSSIKIGDKGYVVLLDSEGNAIATPDKSMLGKDMKANGWAKEVYKKDSDSFACKIDDQDVILSYLTVGKTGWKLIGIMPEAELEKEVMPVRNNFNRLLGIIAGWGILAGLIFAFLMNRMFLKPLKGMIKLMGMAENGDLGVYAEVRSGDEIGQLLNGFNNMLTGQTNILEQVRETADAFCTSSENASAISSNSYDLSQSQSGSMLELTQTIEDMSRSITDVTCNINEIANNTEGITVSMKEMGQAAEEIANSAVDTSAAMSRVTESLQDLDIAITAITQNSDFANKHGGKTVEIALQGKKIVGDTIQEMDNIDLAMKDMTKVITDLGKAADQIGEIIEVIDDIAEQTNLLSLNASIEAARAGEHGKGFAVVASAIGRLSEKSGESTKDIEKLIKQMQEIARNAVESAAVSAAKIKSGVSLVNDTGNAFANIYSAIEETTRLINQIALATAEEYKACSAITESTLKVGDLTMHVSAASEQQLAIVEEIIRSMERVNLLSHEVAGHAEEQAANSQEISATAISVNEMAMQVSSGSEESKTISHELSEQARGLQQMVAKFKLQ